MAKNTEIYRRNIFTYSCARGNLNCAKRIFNSSPKKSIVRTDKEAAFSRAVENGHLQIAQWLLDNSKDDYYLSPKSSQVFDRLFREACIHNHFETVKWLYDVKQISGTSLNFAFVRNKEIIKWMSHIAGKCACKRETIKCRNLPKNKYYTRRMKTTRHRK